MEYYYLIDYFLFVTTANIGIVIVAIQSQSKFLRILGFAVTLLSYGWFFSSKNRNLPTIVEGSQLFITFGLGIIASLVILKLIGRINHVRKYIRSR